MTSRRDIALELLDEIKSSGDRAHEEQRRWERLAEKAIRGEEAAFYFHGPDRDYRIRLVAEPL